MTSKNTMMKNPFWVDSSEDDDDIEILEAESRDKSEQIMEKNGDVFCNRNRRVSVADLNTILKDDVSIQSFCISSSGLGLHDSDDSDDDDDVVIVEEAFAGPIPGLEFQPNLGFSRKDKSSEEASQSWTVNPATETESHEIAEKEKKNSAAEPTSISTVNEFVKSSSNFLPEIIEDPEVTGFRSTRDDIDENNNFPFDGFEFKRSKEVRVEKHSNCEAGEASKHLLKNDQCGEAAHSSVDKVSSAVAFKVKHCESFVCNQKNTVQGTPITSPCIGPVSGDKYKEMGSVITIDDNEGEVSSEKSKTNVIPKIMVRKSTSSIKTSKSSHGKLSNTFKVSKSFQPPKKLNKEGQSFEEDPTFWVGSSEDREDIETFEKQENTKYLNDCLDRPENSNKTTALLSLRILALNYASSDDDDDDDDDEQVKASEGNDDSADDASIQVVLQTIDNGAKSDTEDNCLKPSELDSEDISSDDDDITRDYMTRRRSGLSVMNMKNLSLNNKCTLVYKSTSVQIKDIELNFIDINSSDDDDEDLSSILIMRRGQRASATNSARVNDGASSVTNVECWKMKECSVRIRKLTACCLETPCRVHQELHISSCDGYDLGLSSNIQHHSLFSCGDGVKTGGTKEKKAEFKKSVEARVEKYTNCEVGKLSKHLQKNYECGEAAHSSVDKVSSAVAFKVKQSESMIRQQGITLQGVPPCVGPKSGDKCKEMDSVTIDGNEGELSPEKSKSNVNPKKMVKKSTSSIKTSSCQGKPSYSFKVSKSIQPPENLNKKGQSFEEALTINFKIPKTKSKIEPGFKEAAKGKFDLQGQSPYFQAFLEQEDIIVPEVSMDNKIVNREEFDSMYDRISAIKYLRQKKAPEVSEDVEKGDIDSEGWNSLKSMQTDEERKNWVQFQFKNTVSSDPGRNLTYHGFRMLQNQGSESEDRCYPENVRPRKTRAFTELEGTPSKKIKLSDFGFYMKSVFFSKFNRKLKVGNKKASEADFKAFKIYIGHFKGGLEETTNFLSYYNPRKELAEEQVKEVVDLENQFSTFSTYYGEAEDVYCEQCMERHKFCQ